MLSGFTVLFAFLASPILVYTCQVNLASCTNTDLQQRVLLSLLCLQYLNTESSDCVVSENELVCDGYVERPEILGPRGRPVLLTL